MRRWVETWLARLTEWIREFIPETGWCISEWAICDFQWGDGWWARKGDNRWGAGTARGLNLNRDQIVKIARLTGCKDSVGTRYVVNVCGPEILMHISRSRQYSTLNRSLTINKYEELHRTTKYYNAELTVRNFDEVISFRWKHTSKIITAVVECNLFRKAGASSSSSSK